VRTHQTISQELEKYVTDKEHYNSYEQEILDSYYPAYSKASRNTDNLKFIKDSKDFYDSIIGSDATPFIHFNDTPNILEMVFSMG